MKLKLSLILLIVTSVLAGYYIETNSNPKIPTGTSQEIWVDYINTKYGYALKHPKDVYVQRVSDMDLAIIEESPSVEMGERGTADVGIRITVWEPYAYQATDKAALEYNRIARLDLKSFSQTLRNQFEDDKNQNFPNKKISELEEVTFGGHEAHAATVSGYTDGLTGDTFKYIYVNSGANNMVIQYSLKGDLSKQIIDTFKFTK